MLGGSTVVVVLDGIRVQWDLDLQKYTQQGVETMVKMGEHVAQMMSSKVEADEE